MDATLGLPLLVGLIAVALRVRFPERSARRGQLDRDGRRDARAAAADRGAWAAFFNFVAFAVFGLHVATTVGTGIVEPGVVDGA